MRASELVFVRAAQERVAWRGSLPDQSSAQNLSLKKLELVAGMDSM